MNISHLESKYNQLNRLKELVIIGKSKLLLWFNFCFYKRFDRFHSILTDKKPVHEKPKFVDCRIIKKLLELHYDMTIFQSRFFFIHICISFFAKTVSHHRLSKRSHYKKN